MVIHQSTIAIDSKIFFKPFLLKTNPKYAISNEKIWLLEIPKINLVAKISEGVSKENLDFQKNWSNQKNLDKACKKKINMQKVNL